MISEKRYSSFKFPSQRRISRGKKEATRDCLKACRKLKTACPEENSSCRNWIDYEKEYNCLIETLEKNDDMTLRDIADRLGISFVRVKQIQDKALKKISHLLKDEAI